MGDYKHGYTCNLMIQNYESGKNVTFTDKEKELIKQHAEKFDGDWVPRIFMFMKLLTEEKIKYD